MDAHVCSMIAVWMQPAGAQRGSSHPNGDHGANGKRAPAVFARRKATSVQLRRQDRQSSQVAL